MENEKIRYLLYKNFGDRVKENIFFKNITTFHIGGQIKYYVIVKRYKEVLYILKLCNKYKIKYYIIGGGSNILASDALFDGIVINTLGMNEIKLKKKNIVYAQSGVRLGALIMFCKQKYLSGLEWGIGIPGTIGGATIMNAGAFGGQICSYINKVIYYENGKKYVKKRDDLYFEYRNSEFKNKKDVFIIGVEFKLKYKNEGIITKDIEKYIQIRKNMQNVGYPSAGSIFKRLKNVATAELIERAELKGCRIGDAMISPIHSGYIVNINQATFKDVQNLIAFILKSVYNKFMEKLELEIIIIGEEDGI